MSDSREAAVDSVAGWILVALGLAVLVLVWGTIFTFTVYAGQLAAAFDLSALRVSSVFSVTTAAFFVAGGTMGVLIARAPLRPVVVAVAVTLGVAVGLLQVVSSYAGLVVAFGLVGGAGGTMFVIVVSIVPQWFDRYAGRAMGITLTGNGLGILVLPFAWVWLFERTDVRGAFAVVGGAMVLAVLAASLAYRRPPGIGPEDTTPIDAAWLRRTLTDRRFLAAFAGFALLWNWYFVLSSGLVDILASGGIARTVAATAFGTIGGISVITRVAGGVLADRVCIRETLIGGVVLAALGMFVLPAIHTRPVMYLTLVVFGIGLGVIAALYSPIVIGEFGPENATAIVGLFTIGEAATAFLAPIGVNALIAATGGYAIPLVLVGAATLLGAGLFYWGTEPAASRNGQ